MIRPSALASICPLAPALAEQFPSRSDAADRGVRLHEEFARALTGVDGVYSPGVLEAVRLVHGIRPDIVEIQTERPCVLLDPETQETITKGTADAVLRASDRRIYVIDLKTGLQATTAHPDRNLQIHAYALGVSIEVGAPEYVPGIVWVPDEADASSVVLTLGAPVDGDSMWGWLHAIRAAAMRAPVAVEGPHCSECRVKVHCPSWVLPAYEGETALAPLASPGGLTAANAGQAVLMVKRLRDLADRADEMLRDFARANGGIELDGQVWGPSRRAGRVSVDTEALKRDGLLERYQKRGSSYEAFGWRKVRP